VCEMMTARSVSSAIGAGTTVYHHLRICNSFTCICTDERVAFDAQLALHRFGGDFQSRDCVIYLLSLQTMFRLCGCGSLRVGRSTNQQYDHLCWMSCDMEVWVENILLYLFCGAQDTDADVIASQQQHNQQQAKSLQDGQVRLQ